MKSKIIKLGKKDTPVRIWEGDDGFYIEYLEIENYSNLSEEDMNYLQKPPMNGKKGTTVFFAYMKDVVGYALEHIQHHEEKVQDKNTVDTKITDTSASSFANKKYL